MGERPDSSEFGTQDSQLALPPGFRSLQACLNMPNEEINGKPFVNVIGILKDYQPPVSTRGPDHKCTFTIVDLSTQWDNGVKVNMFYPLEKMPHISSSGDVVLFRKIKVQWYASCVSMITHMSTEVTTFAACRIPPWAPGLSFEGLLQNAALTSKTLPSKPETEYIVSVNSLIDKTSLPTALEFQENVARAVTKREKYCLFKDIKAGEFYDLIGEVRRVVDLDSEKTAVYLSDYTPNTLFYNYKNNELAVDSAEGRDGDEYGYAKIRSRQLLKDWQGPYGKMSMQFTAWDEHSEYFRGHVKVGDWVLLRNVHVVPGKMESYLEGNLRHDRGAFGGRGPQITVFSNDEDPEQVDPRWKEAVRRKKEWEKRHKAQMRDYLDDIEKDKTSKRKLEEKGKSQNNSKRRKTEKLAAAEKNARDSEQKKANKLGLNSSIKANNEKAPYIPVADILSHVHQTINTNSEPQQLAPFSNTNYRAAVRIVNYWPHDLKDFSVGRRRTEYDILSDNSDGNESSDKEENMRQFREGKGFGSKKNWEWRFALQVEDVKKDREKETTRIWLMVDNASAQMLLGLDANNLSSETETFADLKERLFTIWGDLEEKKSAYLKTAIGKTLKWAASASVRDLHSESESESEKQPVKARFINPKTLGQPPDSDDENATAAKPNKRASAVETPKPSVLGVRDPNAGTVATISAIDLKAIRKLPMEEARSLLETEIAALPISNKGFACCIRQYGVRVYEEDEENADAGNGKRWQRMFGLWGTVIN